MKIKALLLFACFVSVALAQSSNSLTPKNIGKGYTVYEGTTVDSFNTEIIGTQNIFMGDVVRTPIPIGRLSGGPAKYPMTHTGVAMGMSGSQIVVNGQIIGALSLTTGFFNKDPICGITPIAYMRNMEEIFRFSGGTPSGKSHISPETIAPIKLLMSGPSFMNNPAIWRPVQDKNFYFVPDDAPRKTSAEKDIPLVPGSAIAVYFVRGDINIAVYGTLTLVEKDGTIYAFGHDIWGNGQTMLPFSAASIITTVANYAASYKLPDNFTPYKIAGTITYDSPVGIKGIIGKKVPMVPVHISLNNQIDEYKQDIKFEIAPMSEVLLAFLPRLIATITANSQPKIKKGATQHGATVTLRHKIEFKNLPPVDVEYIYSFKNDVWSVLIWEYLWSDFYPIAKVLEHIPPTQIKQITIETEYQPETAPYIVYDTRIVGKSPNSTGNYEYWPGDYVYVELKANSLPDTSSHFTTIIPIRIPNEAKESQLALKIVSGNYLRGILEEEIQKDTSKTYNKKLFESLIKTANQSGNGKLYWSFEILLQDQKTVKKEKKEAEKMVVDTINVVRWTVLPQEKAERKTKAISQEIPLSFIKNKRSITANKMLYIKVNPEKSFLERWLVPDPPPKKEEKKKK